MYKDKEDTKDKQLIEDSNPNNNVIEGESYFIASNNIHILIFNIAFDIAIENYYKHRWYIFTPINY